MSVSPWTLLLGCFVPFFGLVVVIFVWRWRIDRRNERLPFGDKLLRPPGESLRKRVEELDDKLNDAIFFALATPLVFAVVLLTLAKRPSAFYLILLVIGAGAFIWLARRFIRVVNERRACLLGFHGERAVAEELNQLMLYGCRVFHDVPMEPYGNIDHVVVAPSGVYAVETKTRRKRKAPAGAQRDHEVTYDGKALHFPHGSDFHALEQARHQADRLRVHLTKAVGEPVRVIPILTLPGWMIASRANTEIKVLNPKLIRHAVVSNDPAALSPQLMQRIAHQLDQKCRDVGL